MKPRHLKNQTLSQFIVPKSNSNQKSENNSNDKIKFVKPDLYSSLIPFHKTNEYYEFLGWIQNWTQSQPSCILFGPTASGKSRLIQQIASELLCHIIEIDCASVSGVKELVATIHESTKSRSVGIFLNHDNSNYDSAISMVVLEHIDSIIPMHSLPPASIKNLISKSLVPLVMTSQYLCIQPAEWLKIIHLHCLHDTFSIIKSAIWLKDSINEFSTNQAIHSLLSFTDQDIRRTALQYQVWNNESNSLLSRDQQIYLSIPFCVQKKENIKEKREFYADICDLFISVNHDDQIFNSYIYPISSDFRSPRREKSFKTYADFAKTRVKHQNYGVFEDLELTEIVYQACINDTSYTRNSTKVSLPPGHDIKPNDIQYVKSWNLWPYEARDLINYQEKNPKNEDKKELKIETDKITEIGPEIQKENEVDNSNLINDSTPQQETNENKGKKRGRKKKNKQ